MEIRCYSEYLNQVHESLNLDVSGKRKRALLSLDLEAEEDVDSVGYSREETEGATGVGHAG